MDKLIAVFSNRNQSMQFASYLKRMGVNCRTINTPRELSISCGLSVEFSIQNLNKARYVLSNNNFSYVRIYRVNRSNIGKKYISI